MCCTGRDGPGLFPMGPLAGADFMAFGEGMATGSFAA